MPKIISIKKQKVDDPYKTVKQLEKLIKTVQDRINLDTKNLKAYKQRLEYIKVKNSITNKYKPSVLYVYVLQLENDCWYIGQTHNVDKRFSRHLAGKGANWTRLNKPIKVYEVRDTPSTTQSECAKYEDKLTLEYASKYGYDKVRGGGYCQTKPKW